MIQALSTVRWTSNTGKRREGLVRANLKTTGDCLVETKDGTVYTIPAKKLDIVTPAPRHPTRRFNHQGRILRVRNVTARISKGFLQTAIDSRFSNPLEGSPMPVLSYQEITYDQRTDKVIEAIR